MLFNSFYSPSYQGSAYGYGYSGYQDLESLRRQRQRAEALAAQHARRAQYLPQEDYSFGSFGPRERAYLDTRRQEVLENERRRREEEAQGRRQQMEELRRQEIARIRQAVELERNRREQARHSQMPFGRGETATDHYTTQPESEDFDRRPQSSSASQQTPKESPADSATDLSTPSATEYTEAHHDAAQRIQQLYRQQRSLRSANHIASQFEEARHGFTLPEAIDFINPSSPSTNDNVITVDTTSLGANSYIKVDVDPEVEAKASDDEHDSSDAVLLPWIEISSGDQTTEQVLPSSPSDSSNVSTPNADDPSDTKVPEEEPFMIITPEQSETSSSPVNDSPVEVATDDYELVGDVPQPGTTLEAVSADETETETEMGVDDSTAQVSRSAQLAYTKQNYPLHAYMEKLYLLLMKLDGVESHGSQKVRDRRKEVARNIEREAERVEALVRDVWRRYSTQ